MALFNVGLEFTGSDVTSTNAFAMRNRIEREISNHAIGTVVGAGMPIGACIGDLDVETDLMHDELISQLEQLFGNLKVQVTIFIDEIEPDE